MDIVDIRSLSAERPKKRRRRTMACQPCRSRKLRCDREYPTCSRCLKSRTPSKCTYEDGFLWQQPATVGAPISPDQGSTVPQPEQNVQIHPDSGLVSTRPDELVSTSALGLGSTLDARPQDGPHQPQHEHQYQYQHPHPHSHPHPHPHPHHKGRHSGRERGFLETVLGAPKAAVNQEPYMNTGLLHRQKRSAPDPEIHFASQVDSGDIDEGDEEDPLSPSQQLDISPRIMMRGRETKTRYSGSGIYANLVAQVCLNIALFPFPT